MTYFKAFHTQSSLRALLGGALLLLPFLLLDAAFATPSFEPLPASSPLPVSIQRELERRYKDVSEKQSKSALHLTSSGTPKFINRLALEKSPYLQQHAFNPINWYPWGEEAFQKAKELNRPVFLSIGYSTCHWCHVMAEESFEDLEIARYLNQHYIAIKVDREERPDIDALYMTVVQIMNKGRGGWPMSVWLTNSQEPFYAGTYFPPRKGAASSSIGLLELLQRLATLYSEKGERLKKGSAQITKLLQETSSSSSEAGKIKESSLHKAAAYYLNHYDPQHGGITSEPKFPNAFASRFLLRYARRSAETRYKEVVRHTLHAIAKGGIRDHIGGGFHRYSTDTRWRIPHFEKMLYDNALLVVAYLEAFQSTQNREFLDVAEDTLRYLKTDLLSPEGMFYSATDAVSPTPAGVREEGWYYTWSKEELTEILSPQENRIFGHFYNLSTEGNFRGRSIPFVEDSVGETAEKLGLSEKEVAKQLKKARAKVLQARLQRQAPVRDELVITAWNALAISAFARGARVLREPKLKAVATQAATALLQHLYVDSQLYRSWKEGEKGSPAFLNDYAFFIAACLDLFESTQELAWLKHAIEFEALVSEKFEDKDMGGYFISSDTHETLIARQKPNYDGAIPSGNSVMALNLLRLATITSNDSYQKRVERILRAFSTTLNETPEALSEMLLAVDYLDDDTKEVLVAFPSNKVETNPFASVLANAFTPNQFYVELVVDKETEEFEKIIPLSYRKKALSSLPTAYVCTKGICKLPTNNPGVFLKQVSEISPYSLSAKGGEENPSKPTHPGISQKPVEALQ